MGSKMIGFRVPEDIAAEVEAKATERGQTTAEFLRKLVDDALYPAKGDDGLSELVTVVGEVPLQTKVDELRVSFEQDCANLRGLAARLDADGGVVAQLREEYEGLRGIMLRMAEMNDEHAKVCDDKLAKLHICPDCGRALHRHMLNDGNWHLECVVCGYYSPDYKPTKWKDKPGEHPIPVKSPDVKSEAKSSEDEDLVLTKVKPDNMEGWEYLPHLELWAKKRGKFQIPSQKVA